MQQQQCLLLRTRRAGLLDADLLISDYSCLYRGKRYLNGCNSWIIVTLPARRTMLRAGQRGHQHISYVCLKLSVKYQATKPAWTSTAYINAGFVEKFSPSCEVLQKRCVYTYSARSDLLSIVCAVLVHHLCTLNAKFTESCP